MTVLARIAARHLLAHPDLVVLDTETTGLNEADQIVEIAIVDASGAVLLDTLVRPTCEISPGAYELHNLSADALAAAPTWADLWPQVQALLDGRLVATYNSRFDLRLLLQSCAAHGIHDPVALDPHCLMQLATNHLKSKRWLSLGQACFWLDVTPQPPAHRALGDARTALAVLRAIAEASDVIPLEAS